MVPAGYMAKQVATRPEWLERPGVADICSVSLCISKAFCDYVGHWRHNANGLFGRPADIAAVAHAASVDTSGCRLFYYEVFERQYNEATREWRTFDAASDTQGAIEAPVQSWLLGFDVVTFSAQTWPECSPLSCNSLADSIPVNAHCLLPTLERAKELLEACTFDHSEPGPFRVFSVYECPWR